MAVTTGSLYYLHIPYILGNFQFLARLFLPPLLGE